MFILIPLGGQGKRFKIKGYKQPKALIPVDKIPIIYHLLENLNLKNIDFVYIPYNKEYEEYNFEENLRKDFPNINFCFYVLEKQTSGAGETIQISLEKLALKTDIPVLCLDSDNFYTVDIVNLWKGENKVFVFKDKGEDIKYSYIKNDKNKIVNIVEKDKISNLACCGAYGFKSVKELYQTTFKNKKQKDEFYISGIIKELLNSTTFKYHVIQNKNYYNLGTPEQVEIFKRTLLFDLDGTLVQSDSLYYKVWEEILFRYDICIDYNFFEDFIRGKSDKDFLKSIFPDITEGEIKKISDKKDVLFIEILKKEDIIFPDVLKFFEKNKNSKIAIVTSCNKKSAMTIIKKYNLDEYIDLVIASEDCFTHKPSPEPYLKALEMLYRNKENCFIFEDSLSGFKSALSCDIEKIYIRKSDLVLEHSDVFTNLEEIEFCKKVVGDEKIEKINSLLRKILPPVKKIRKDIQNLKSGYICDIEKYKVSFNDDSEINIVLKISNFDNELSKVAQNLNLYKNEEYFYKDLSGMINLNIPKFYSLVQIGEKRIGIIMEDLYKYKGNFNLNLNRNVKMLMKIVENVSDMHSKFYYKKECNLELSKVKNIEYYKKLIYERFHKFMKRNKYFLNERHCEILNYLYLNLQKHIELLSSYPLSLCHGDLKSPNIFYKDDKIPYYLDWQYIHLNKGVSDIVFLLVESLDFNSTKSDLVLEYYYLLSGRTDYLNYKKEIEVSLGVFPFFVTVWFNTEDNDKLLDKTFGLRFMKNYLKYLEHYF